MVENAPGIQRPTTLPNVAVDLRAIPDRQPIPDAGLLFAARTVSAPQPLAHRAHGWVVDVNTHNISKRRCPACEAAPVTALADVAAPAKVG